MARFEIAIYNDRVRQAMKNGDKCEYSDDWADVHFIEIQAHSMDEARNRILTKYPKHKGFILQGIKSV